MQHTRYIEILENEITPITFSVVENTFIFNDGQNSFKVERINSTQLKLTHTQTQQQHLAYFIQQDQTIELFFEGQVVKGKVFSKPPRTKKAEVLRQFTPEIKSPMPGKILKVLIKEGETVEAKQPLILMESMKMELTISSNHPASVEKILIKSDDLVNLGQTLLTLKET